MTAPFGAGSGAVYDRGYRPYEGPRGGRGAARAALWRASVRRALGLRRDWRQKVFPWALVALATLPAIFAVMGAYAASRDPFGDVELVDHREYLGVSSVLWLFVATVAPDLVCPDRRNRTLPLIFARPLTGDDYAGSKFAALASLLFGFVLVPQVVLFVGQMLITDDGALDYFTDHVGVLWQVPVAAALIALLYAAIGLAVAATTSRRVVGSVAILALLIVTSTVAAVGENQSDDAGSSSPPTSVVEIDPEDLEDLDPEDFEDFEGFEDFESFESQGSAWALVDVASIPLFLADVVFLGEADRDGRLAGVDGGSAAAAAIYVVLLAASLAYLHRRYRTVDL